MLGSGCGLGLCIARKQHREVGEHCANDKNTYPNKFGSRDMDVHMWMAVRQSVADIARVGNNTLALVNLFTSTQMSSLPVLTTTSVSGKFSIFKKNLKK